MMFKRREIDARALTGGMKIKIGGKIATVASVYRLNGDEKTPPLFTSLGSRTAVALQISFLDHESIISHPARMLPLA